MLDLTGIYPALITPFTANDEIDEHALRNLVEITLNTGVQGFYVGGSTAESLLMSMDERKRALEIVIDQVGKRVKVIAHIGCFHTQDSIRLADHAASVGVVAISSIPPIYYKFTLEELTQYYLDIVEAVPLPMIIYNIPALTGVTFNSQNTVDLFKHDLIAGVKYTSYDLYQMQRMISRNPGKVMINGHDEIFLSSLAIGVRCGIGSSYNVMPGKFLGILDNFLKGNLEQARLLQDQANQVLDVLIKMGIFRGVKGMLELMGIPCGSCRKPFKPLTVLEKQQLIDILPLIS